MKILFISYNRLGDAVLSSGIYNRLVEQHPGARMTVACGPVPAPLFACAPGLDELIVLEKRPRLGHWIELWRRTVGRRWDMVVDLRGSAMGWLLWASRRHAAGPRPGPVHRVQMLADVIGATPPPSPALWTTPAHEQAAAGLLSGDRPVLGIGPTANWGGKQWPADRFAALAQRLVEQGPLAGARIAVFGAPHERAAAAPVLDALPADQTVDLVGSIDLPTVYACLKRCRLYVGNDSGLMHMAAAAGIPTLGLFGPSEPERYGPWGAQNASVRTDRSYPEIVNHPDYDYRRADSWMLDLSVERVEAAAQALLQAVAPEAA